MTVYWGIMPKPIYFYVELNSAVAIDFSLLPNGNPGIGGTQYATLCLALELSKNELNEIGLIAPFVLEVPDGMTFILKDSLNEAVRFVESSNGILVFRPTITLEPSFTSLIATTTAELIAWTHVTPSQRTLRKLARSKSVKAIVALGKRQLLSWIDNPAAGKTIIIKNGQYIPKNVYPSLGSPKYVTYLGSMVPQKGFHLLAKVWPRIHLQNPQLRLKVIGSGSLYDANARLGDHGIASHEYEEVFMNSLGNSSIAVDFLGKVGAGEKNLIIVNSYLGIVNPSGNTENCPAAALDFQALEVPVISARKNGLIDTVLNGKTGVLFRDHAEIPEIVNFLIENEDIRNSLSRNCLEFVQSEFNFQSITAEWEALFTHSDSENPRKRVSYADALSKTEKLAFINAKLGTRFFGRFFWPTTLEILNWSKKVAKRLLMMLKQP